MSIHLLFYVLILSNLFLLHVMFLSSLYVLILQQICIYIYKYIYINYCFPIFISFSHVCLNSTLHRLAMLFAVNSCLSFLS